MPHDVDYRFNTVEAATTGALQYLEPYWNDDFLLAIHNGVRLPDMPANAVITGSPGYRLRINAGLYDLDEHQLQAEIVGTLQRSDEQARQTAIHHDIPIGQQVHAFCLLHDKLPRKDRLKLHDYLDRMMPEVAKRRRQRHLKTFLIITSDDWPFIQAHAKTAEIEIAGMDSILKAARAYSPPQPRHKKVRTPLKERYVQLRAAVLDRRYEEARRLVLQFDEEDDDDAPEGSYAEDDALPVRRTDDLTSE